jgi:hypothetical protein
MSDFIPLFLFRRKFSPEEDSMLRVLVRENGIGDWKSIASQMPDRDVRQCKERWFHYLAPCLVQKAWTPDDDVLLEAKVAQYGNRWKFFECFFPGRTDVSIKNRYNVLMRRKKAQAASISRAFSTMSSTSPESATPSTTLQIEEINWGFQECEWSDGFSS